MNTIERAGKNDGPTRRMRLVHLSIRKTMAPASRIHGASKFKRSRFDWRKEV